MLVVAVVDPAGEGAGGIQSRGYAPVHAHAHTEITLSIHGRGKGKAFVLLHLQLHPAWAGIATCHYWVVLYTTIQMNCAEQLNDFACTGVYGKSIPG